MINFLGKQLYLKTGFLVQLIRFQQPLGTLLILNYTNKLMALPWEDQHLQPKQKFIWRLMNKLQYKWHYTLQKIRNNLLLTLIPFCKGTPKLLAYIDFIYSTTMQLCELYQSNLLLTSLYVHKLKFISHKLCPSSSSHGQLRELVNFVNIF